MAGWSSSSSNVSLLSSDKMSPYSASVVSGRLSIKSSLLDYIRWSTNRRLDSLPSSVTTSPATSPTSSSFDGLQVLPTAAQSSSSSSYSSTSSSSLEAALFSAAGDQMQRQRAAYAPPQPRPVVVAVEGSDSFCCSSEEDGDGEDGYWRDICRHVGI